MVIFTFINQNNSKIKPWEQGKFDQTLIKVRSSSPSPSPLWWNWPLMATVVETDSVWRIAQSTPSNLQSKVEDDTLLWMSCTWWHCWGSRCSWGCWSGWRWSPRWSWPAASAQSPSPGHNKTKYWSKPSRNLKEKGSHSYSCVVLYSYSGVVLYSYRLPARNVWLYTIVYI